MIPRLFAVLTITVTAIALIAVDSARAEALDAAQFRAQLVGKKLETRRMGLPARLVFTADGRVSMQAPVGAGQGTWTMEGRRICVTMTSGPRAGKRCGTFTKLADGRYAGTNGQVFSVR